MTKKETLRQERIIRELADLFRGERGAQNTIAMFGEDGADAEFIANRLAEEYPWASELISSVM